MGAHDRDVLSSLRAEVRRRGLLEKATGRIVAELAAHAVIAIAGIGLLIAARDPWLFALGLLTATVGSLGVATNTHGSSHYATSDRRWVNELLTYVGYPCFLQLSATYWRRKHVIVHHHHPNVAGVDDDIDLAPWFVLTVDDYRRAGALRRCYHRVQWLLVPLAIAAIGFNMHLAGWRHLLRALMSPSERRPAHWIDVACMVLHVLVWIVLPMYLVGAPRALTVYTVRIAALSVALFCVLAPAHFPIEASCLRAGSDDDDFVWRQTATTVNYSGGSLGAALCSGLQYQIEHHLFPSVSHVHYPKLQPLVREFCLVNGYPYRVLPWPEAIWKSLRVFWSFKPTVSAAPPAMAVSRRDR